MFTVDRKDTDAMDAYVGHEAARPLDCTMISGSHIRAARKLLNWGPDRLAKRARLALGVVLQAERDEDMSLISPSASRSIQQALEEAGIEWAEPPALVRFRS